MVLDRDITAATRLVTRAAPYAMFLPPQRVVDRCMICNIRHKFPPFAVQISLHNTKAYPDGTVCLTHYPKRMNRYGGDIHTPETKMI